MSKGNLSYRLEALERDKPAAKAIMVWCDALRGETTAEAIAKQYPEGVPAGAPVYVLQWQTAER